MPLENLAKAVIAVMKSVKGIDKGMTIGTGSSSYKGVSDKDVKNIIGETMQENGLCILPIGVEAKTQIDRWEEIVTWNGVSAPKTKQSVLSEVTTKYLLLHESGEYVEIAGYGHGIDPQDKAAGKATTYALKYTLLYTFMVATGKIDDADNEHSDSKDVPKGKTVAEPTTQQKVDAMLKIRVSEQVQSEVFEDKHKEAINHAATTAILTSIWNQHKSLQTDDKFIEAIKTRRNELTAK